MVIASRASGAMRDGLWLSPLSADRGVAGRAATLEEGFTLRGGVCRFLVLSTCMRGFEVSILKVGEIGNYVVNDLR